MCNCDGSRLFSASVAVAGKKLPDADLERLSQRSVHERAVERDNCASDGEFGMVWDLGA